MGMNEQSRVDRLIVEGRDRVLILDVKPAVDNGRYAAKRVIGDEVTVSCDLVSDGHDVVHGVLRVCAADQTDWSEYPLQSLGNDRFAATFTVSQQGRWAYEVEGWVDDFETWRTGVIRKHEAGQDVTVELASGIGLIEGARTRAGESGAEADAERLQDLCRDLESVDAAQQFAIATSDELRDLVATHPDRSFSTRSGELPLLVEPLLARFTAWYELFPRSLGEAGAHGTFADLENILPYVSSMGFDVLYLPPIHPIGTTFRKGPNNTLEAGPNDPGSPWAIGSEAGGHKEIHPELGSVDEFRRFVQKASDMGIAVALDIAFQASPDHPYVRSHPEWFKHRADGTIQYAENPPKKYQDVYPFDLSGPAWKPLWEELVSVFEVWIERGVRVFRVDNPHTKPLRFWEYCIRKIKDEHPDVVFLSEAFTRPKLMYALAKVGFSQSYTYFTWRTTAHELRAYLEELTRTEVAEYFRPSFWPNTPDILPEHLQYGGRPMFVARMILAGTLSSSWGIYGPAFELMEHTARPGSGEYLDNEKFQLRTWDLERQDSLRPVIERLNRIRRDNPALQSNDTLTFHECDNANLLVYSKTHGESENTLVVVVNLEPYHRHSGWVTLDLEALGLTEQYSFQVHDLIGDARHQWQGRRVYVELDPAMPAHVFRVRRHVRTEHSFEYFL